MRIGRTVPPTAAPLRWWDLWHGVWSAFFPGQAIRAREAELRATFGVSDVFLLSSGSAALTLTLLALKSLSNRSDVIIPAYTCFSVPAAVLKAGLRPRLCDVQPSTFDFDHGLLADTIDSNTLCVIAHHLFGVASDIPGIRKLCEGRGTFVVEDAAQAMGIEYQGSKLGTLGDVGIFSLGRGKSITCGSGGIIVTRSRKIADRIEKLYRQTPTPSTLEVIGDLARAALLTTFVRPQLYWIPASLPFLRLGETVFPTDIPIKKMSAAKAGLLRRWRARLQQANRVRLHAAADLCRRMAVTPPSGDAHVYLRLPFLTTAAAEKRRLFSASMKRGLGVSVAYPQALSELPQLRPLMNGHEYPNACRLASELVTLPIHQWVTDRDKQAIAELCANVGGSRA